MSLKTTHDGLSKVWKPKSQITPFFRGGKVIIHPVEDIIVSEFDGDVKIADFTRNLQVSSFASGAEATTSDVDPVAMFCMHPNAKEVVVATSKSLLQHVSLETKEKMRSIKAHRMPILTMDFDPTGTLVATGSADKTVKVCDILKGYCTHSFSNHTDVVKLVRFHPDAERLMLFSTSDDNTICVYDLRDSTCVATFKDHVSLPVDLAVVFDGYTLASAGRDKVLNFYELRSLTLVKTIPIMEELESILALNDLHSQALIRAAGLTVKKNISSSVLILGGEHGILKFGAVEQRGRDESTFAFTFLFQISLSTASVTAVLSEDMQRLRAVHSLHYRPDKGQIVAFTQDANIAFYDLNEITEKAPELIDETGRTTCRPSKMFIGSFGEVLDIISLPSTTNDVRLAVVANSPQLRLLKGSSGLCDVLDGHTDLILSADCSDDGQWMVTAGKDRSCRLWSLAHSTLPSHCIATALGHTEAIAATCISHTIASYQSHKAAIFSGGGDKILKRWALPHSILKHTSTTIPTQPFTLAASHNVRAHDKDINCLAMAPNDTIIATGSQDKSIKIWSSSDLSTIATLSGHRRGIWRLRFSPVDRILCSCSGDRTVRLWSLSDYSSIRTLEGHTASVLNAVFVNHSTQLISSSADGLLRLWTVRTGECVTTMEQHEDRVWALDMQQDADGDTMLVSGGSDAAIIFWRDATVEEEAERLTKAEQQLAMEQQLSTDLQQKRYKKALFVALDLDMPHRTLQILTAILEEEEHCEDVDGGLESRVQRFDSVLLSLDAVRLSQLLTYLPDWNSNSQHCFVSQALLASAIRTFKMDKLMTMAAFKENVPGLLAYTERHFQRIGRISQAAYIMDYVASQMSATSMLPLDTMQRLQVKKSKMTTQAAPLQSANSTEMDVVDVIKDPVSFVAVKQTGLIASSKKGIKRKAIAVAE